jgi:uncharacterized membrane protein required for colicin V production
MSMDGLPFNAFDLFFVAILVAGVFKGRKKGMSGELISMIKWLVILLGCAMAYEPLGSMFGQSTSIFSKLSCYLMAYLGTALIVVLIFAGLKNSLGGKLAGSDAFGNAEYYLGMGAGFVRFACALFVGLALLNAPYFSPQEVKASEKYQNEWYGSTYFPTLHGVQSVVFEKSLVGPLIKDNLGFLLIKPVEPETKELHQKEAKW